MPRDMMQLPMIGRSASVRPESVDRDARTVEVCWTTGATVQRYRFEGWDDVIEYDEELVVSQNAVRLDRMNAGAPFLDSHRGYGLESVLGTVVPGSVRIDGGRGYATVQLTGAEDVLGKVQRILEGTVRSVSVGYRVHHYEIDRKDGEREHWRAVDWEPMEISAVPVPADPGAHTRSAGGRPDVFPCLMVRAGSTAAVAANREEASMPGENENAAAEDQVRTDEAVETRRDPDPRRPGQDPADPSPAPSEDEPAQPGDPEAAAQRAVAAERQRTSTINQICRRHGMDGAFADDLVARGISVDRARSAILDALAERDPMQGRSFEPAPASARDNGSRSAGYRDGLENALLHRVDPSRNELTDAGREFRGMTLLEMARHSLERSGVNTRGMGRMDLAAEVFRFAGLHSTSDFPVVLGNVANNTLRTSYADTPRTFTAWARRETISDFRPVARTSISGAPNLEKVLESGEFQYGTIGEATELYALATYGKIIGFTRQLLINDNLGAFTRMTEAFGASAARLEGDIVYQILLQNPLMADGIPLFDADHGNLGAPAPINEESLTAAFRSFAEQTGVDGVSIDVSPSLILVPPGPRALEARKQLSPVTAGTTADVNAYAGSLQVIEERRLITAEGEDPWFLASTPTTVDTVEYAYLDGQEGVFTETRVGFEVDGIEIKARHDFAAKAIDWRGLYKNPGV